MMVTVRQGIGMTSSRTRERLIQRLKEQGIADPRVLELVRTTPRHLFVDEALASRAYEDTALPIGQGQTISQPYIVARMTEALFAAGPLATVLEVGTGCGYQTAILAQLAPTVYSVERINALLVGARRRLRELRLHTVKLKHTDGGWGWPEYAPYAGIIVTAAPETVPDELLHQLADGGRLVIPVGPAGEQELLLLVRQGNTVTRQSLGRVSFVPLLSGTQ